MQKDTQAEIVRLDERIKGLDRLLEERQTALRAAFAASEKAVEKAENAQLRVNLAQNEFRGALSDQAKFLASKENLEALDRRVQLVERAISGGAGGSSAFAAAKHDVFTIIAILISLAVLVLHFWSK